MKKQQIDRLEKEIKKSLQASNSADALSFIQKKYLGQLSLIFKSFKDLSKQEKIKTAKKINKIKENLIKDVNNRIKSIQEKEFIEKEEKEWIDVTSPGQKINIGNLHPITKSLNKCIKIFENMGFSVINGPELENEWYNFDALNFPEDHPAREMQDTFFIKQNNRDQILNKKKLLMRTHTSPVQIRHMEKNEPPLRIIVPGRVFRNEATDASHEVGFYQVEGLMIDKNISVAHFKAVIKEFCNLFFEKEIEIRLRPSFFPFTEPSFEVDIGCSVCNKKGCSLCSQTGWLEMFGAGMVHPNVLKNSGINHKKWQGFAFGLGWDRILMMNHKINDIRLLYNGDLRFLKQF